MRALLFLHLSGVAFWLGGQLFLLLVVLPALRGRDPDERLAIIRPVARTYGRASIPALLLILVTGGWMAHDRGLLAHPTDAFTLKLWAVAMVLAGTVVHAVAGARRSLRVSRIASSVTLVATLAAVWLATGL